METLTTNHTALTYHTAPEDQGQLVAVAYAWDGDLGRIVRRITSETGAVEYHSLPGGGHPIDFWNGVGSLEEHDEADWEAFGTTRRRRHCR